MKCVAPASAIDRGFSSSERTSSASTAQHATRLTLLTLLTIVSTGTSATNSRLTWAYLTYLGAWVYLGLLAFDVVMQKNSFMLHIDCQFPIIAFL